MFIAASSGNSLRNLPPATQIILHAQCSHAAARRKAADETAAAAAKQKAAAAGRPVAVPQARTPAQPVSIPMQKATPEQQKLIDAQRQQLLNKQAQPAPHTGKSTEKPFMEFDSHAGAKQTPPPGPPTRSVTIPMQKATPEQQKPMSASPGGTGCPPAAPKRVSFPSSASAATGFPRADW